MTFVSRTLPAVAAVAIPLLFAAASPGQRGRSVVSDPVLIEQRSGTQELLQAVSVVSEQVVWVSEAGTRAETDTQQLRKVVIPAHGLYAMPQTT